MRKLIERLIRFLKRLLNLDDGAASLNPVTHLEVIVMARNVLVRWTNPTARTDGEPATANDIGEIHIGMRLQSQSSFSRVATITDPTQIAAAQRSFPNTPSGRYRVQVTGVDKAGQPFDQAAEADFEVPAAALNGVSDLVVEVAAP